MLITSIKSKYLSLVENNNPDKIKCWKSIPLQIHNIVSHGEIFMKKNEILL